MTIPFTTETEITPPATVGDFIQFLQQFPADYTLDLFKKEISDHGRCSWDENVYQIKVQALTGAKALEITTI